MSIVVEFGNENFIICGDFNLVLCPELDYCNYLHVNNPKSREKVLELIEERSLIDPYRQLYPDSFRYTWRKKIHLDRLDWIFSFLQKVCLLI